MGGVHRDALVYLLKTRFRERYSYMAPDDRALVELRYTLAVVGVRNETGLDCDRGVRTSRSLCVGSINASVERASPAQVEYVQPRMGYRCVQGSSVRRGARQALGNGFTDRSPYLFEHCSQRCGTRK